MKVIMTNDNLLSICASIYEIKTNLFARRTQGDHGRVSAIPDSIRGESILNHILLAESDVPTRSVRTVHCSGGTPDCN